MVSIIKKIIAEDKTLIFFFSVVDEVNFYVEVLEKERNVYSFIMKENEKCEWVIEGKENLPSYIVDLEKQLSDTINNKKM